MAPSLITQTLSICSLFSLLLFLHVHGISAREIKVEEEPPKQNEASHIHFPSQKDKNDAGYIHSQKDQKEKSESYTTTYGESERDDRSYIIAYGNAQMVNQHYQKGNEEKADQAYLVGYRQSQKDQKEKSKPYITAYGASKSDDPSYLVSYSHNDKKEKSKPYITAYGASKREDQSYLTGYSHNDKKEKSRPYITAYGASKREDQSYLAGYSHSDKKEKDTPYITAYGANKGEDRSYLTGYSRNDKKEKGESYITAYGGSKRDDQSYIIGYINAKKVNPAYGKRDSQGENPKESYAATYAKDSRDSYIASYAKDSKNSNAATYGKEYSGNTDITTTNKVDHSEAFKAGFFALDDLYVGNRMTLQFPIENFPHFLSKKEGDSIPFSSSQLPSVLQLLSIPQDSPEAQEMRGSLELCELQPLTAERKVCVSSLESMIDFVRSIIGSDSQLDILTTTYPATSIPLQNFTILDISPEIYAPKWVACHPVPYPYAVFYCHFIGSGTKIFKVKLGSENGEQMEALGVCHLDSSEWDPEHILFKWLGFKPGEAPVCHFLPVKHLMWIPLPSEATM